jgi:hypothetical protein
MRYIGAKLTPQFSPYTLSLPTRNSQRPKAGEYEMNATVHALRGTLKLLVNWLKGRASGESVSLAVHLPTLFSSWNIA